MGACCNQPSKYVCVTLIMFSAPPPPHSVYHGYETGVGTHAPALVPNLFLNYYYCMVPLGAGAELWVRANTKVINLNQIDIL